MAKKLTYEEVKNQVETMGFELISKEYINAVSNLDLKCNYGHEFTINLHNLKSRGCKICRITKKNLNRRLSFNDVKLNIEKEGYLLLSTEYNNVSEKLKVKCPKDHLYDVAYSKFKSGQRCPRCNTSKSEMKIRKYLENKDVKFKEQYMFDDCKDKRKLRFDFAIFENNMLKCLIEYDGEQHYIKTSRYNKDKDLKEIQNKDNIKNEYCNKNRIKLIRIPYWEKDNIESILDDVLR